MPKDHAISCENFSLCNFYDKSCSSHWVNVV